MLEEQRKIVRITAELTMFFLEVGAGNISSHVEIEGSVGDKLPRGLSPGL